jgi:glycosyltransferase involved in cell wall biosynthesis
MSSHSYSGKSYQSPSTSLWEFPFNCNKKIFFGTHLTISRQLNLFLPDQHVMMHCAPAGLLGRQIRNHQLKKMKKAPSVSTGSEKPDSIIRSFENDPGRLSREQIRENIYASLIAASRGNNVKDFKKALSRAMIFLKRHVGIQAALNIIRRIEIYSGIRKPTLAIYDNCLHFIGGGQKYGMTMAEALQDRFDIAILANKTVSHQQIFDWYNLDLSNCPIKIIPLPFYEQLGTVHLDPALVTKKMKNPFHPVSLESGNYDFFINNSMLEMVFPLSGISVMMVHFPERRPVFHFYPPFYTRIMYNSRYTASWIEKKWNIVPHKHIYPPVDMETSENNNPKKNLIISVARFEEGGTKKQIEMVKAFSRLKEISGRLSSGWKLILAGGSNPGNPYLESVKKLIRGIGKEKIELKVNISADELKSLYQDAKIFWHLCGLGQHDPSKIEHFGMTICEAMQNSLVPLVFDGGGQREIVEHGLTGFRVNSSVQLIHHSLELMKNRDKLQAMAKLSSEKSKQYNKERFSEEIRRFFDELLENYLNPRKDET